MLEAMGSGVQIAPPKSVKVMSWNGNNDGLELGMNASAAILFIRVPDHSLKMWRSYITVNNATLWQNYNGVVVNLGSPPIRQRWRSNRRPLRCQDGLENPPIRIGTLIHCSVNSRARTTR